jgi:sulfur carrier protein
VGAVQPAAVHGGGDAVTTISLNGEPREIPPGTSVAELIAMVTGRASGVATAVNGEVVSRGSWAATQLTEGDRVEVVTAVQGG